MSSTRPGRSPPGIELLPLLGREAGERAPGSDHRAMSRPHLPMLPTATPTSGPRSQVIRCCLCTESPYLSAWRRGKGHGGEVRGTVLGSSAMCLTSSSTSQTRSEDTSQRPVARGWAGLGLAAAKTHPKSSSCYCIAIIITILFPILSASHCLEEVVPRKEISVSTHMTESLKRSEKCRQESIP